MKTANVTDLKNNLSAHLKRVVAGETIVVTDRNRPVAVFQPLEKGWAGSRLAGLVAAGVVSPARERVDVKALLRMPRGRSRQPLSTAISEDRDER
jgi:prevent-host-death family protein